MKSWPKPFIPAVPGRAPAVRLRNTATGELVEIPHGDPTGLYVCGITPYDATHMGHAATYVTFDLVGRILRDAGHDVLYVQNTTDVDDPLLERAQRDNVPWESLAAKEIGLFREDMTDLGVIPPDHYTGVVESVDLIAESVRGLLARGAAYRVETPDAAHDGAQDVYYDIAADPDFGTVSRYDEATMLRLSAERGGDPDRPGKRNRLDPLLWRVERSGEPAWDAEDLGRGRPGWHIECTAIALQDLGMGFAVQGGGTDLIFPHHEMSAAHAESLTGEPHFAQAYVHQAMVGLDGEKMSKSKGNLVLVSRLRAEGVDPMAIRLALLAHHYATEWEWTEADLRSANERLATWRDALGVNTAPAADETIEAVRAAVAEDLDSPRALAAVDAWAQRTLTEGGDDPAAPGLMARTLDRVLGVRV